MYRCLISRSSKRDAHLGRLELSIKVVIERVPCASRFRKICRCHSRCGSTSKPAKMGSVLKSSSTSRSGSRRDVYFRKLCNSPTDLQDECAPRSCERRCEPE